MDQIKIFFKKVLVTFSDSISLFRPLLLVAVWIPAIQGFMASNIKPTSIVEEEAPAILSTGNNWLFLVATLLGASVFIINQIYDRKADKEGKKHLPIAEGFISTIIAWILYSFVSILALFVSFTWHWLPGIFTLVGIILGILYSHPKISLKDKPWGGLALNGLGHGVLMFLLGYSWSKAISLDALLQSVPYLFAFSGVYLFTTLPDMKTDQNFGKITLAVKLGERRTALLGIALILIAVGISIYVTQPVIWLTGIFSIPFYIYSIFKSKGYVRANKVAVLSMALFTALVKLWFVLPLFIAILFVSLYNWFRYKVKYP